MFFQGLLRNKRLYSNSIVLDQAKKMVEEKRLPEDFLSTADDLDNIAQKYKDEIRNQTVSSQALFAFEKSFRKFPSGVS